MKEQIMRLTGKLAAARRRTMLKVLGAGLCAYAAAGTAVADEYPSKPIRVLIPFPAGGSSDIVTRMVTKKMGEQTGWNFVPENKPGAGGNVTFEIASQADPDGYTILFSTPGIVINPHLYRRVPYQWDDFVPIGLIGEAPLVLMVNPKLPVKSIADLQALSREKPKSVKFASSGNGSSSHLAMDVLRTMGDISYLHIPYRGGAPAMIDSISGIVDMTMLPISESLPNIRGGRLRALGQTGSSRSPIAPEIPTIEEGGIKGYSVTTWYVVLAPKKTPASVVKTFHGALETALKDADLQKELEQAGVQVINGGPDEAAAFMKKQYDQWEKAIAASGTKLE
jgi:tripartite-type tricarboxylate transporter receptor subunit TctC